MLLLRNSDDLRLFNKREMTDEKKKKKNGKKKTAKKRNFKLQNKIK